MPRDSQLHKAARDGDVNGVREVLDQGKSTLPPREAYAGVPLLLTSEYLAVLLMPCF
jgi:hypothetical protein